MKPLHPGQNHNLVSDDETAEEENRFLTPGNTIILGLLLTLLVYLGYKFTIEEMWNIAKAALGLSFVIFIHELGHFLAAKWCDVNVTTFSIGFGPAIPGCKWKWGETTYMLAILPLGGYVQMVGQVDGDESSDGSEDDPRSYRRKTVAQRMLIISAGVIMNAILAVVCFIGVYEGPGKDYPAAVINMIDSNAPAYKQGLRTGADIIEIGDIQKPTFTQLTQTVINSMEGEKIKVVYERFSPKEPPVTVMIEPRMDSTDTKPVIGVAPPPRLQFITKQSAQEGPYLAGTPAARAKLQYGDSIIGMTDPQHPDKVTLLPDDPRLPNHGQCDYFEFARRLQLLADQTITIKVRRHGADTEVIEEDVKVEPMYRLNLGVRMQMGPIMIVREKSPADGKVFGPRDNKLEGDLIEAVSVVEPDGTTKEFEGKDLDPERLPRQLRQWSDRVRNHKAPNEAQIGPILDKWLVTLRLRRHRAQPGNQYEKELVKLKWDDSWRFDRVVPISLNAPMAIPELGLAYQISTKVEGVNDGLKDWPLKKNDVIKNVRYEVEGSKEDIKGPYLSDDLEAGQWANLSFELFSQPYKYKKLVFKIEREGKTQEVEMPIGDDTSWPLEDRGWKLAKDLRRIKATSAMQAVWMGLSDTHNRMMEVFQNLRGMIFGRISVKNLGGPLTIAYGTYRFASMDFADLVFFLGLISINLAVVNFLPIPVLDGGHMVFLIYEKIRGQPASEGVRIAATYLGLVMILSLMCFVLYLDMMRLFF
jgi:regulator of sigma E protease